MNGLAPKTSELFEAVSRLECIKPFVLVGGTALSLQLNHRQSEDLDFMKWKAHADDPLDVGWHLIKKELEGIGKIESMELYGFDMVEFVISDVKLSFYAAPRKTIPSMHDFLILNNLRIADKKSIGAMKMEVLLRRAKFRDYYDIYSIVKDGVDINEMMTMALEHSNHVLKRKNLMALLTNGELFSRDQNIVHLNPFYQVTAFDIQEYFKAVLQKDKHAQ